MASINDAIRQAQQAAEDAVVLDQTPSTAVGEYVAPAAPAPALNLGKLSIDNLPMTAGIAKNVEDWLKVNEYGLTVGTDKTILSEIKASVLLVQDEGFYLKHSIKYGNPAQYFSSYDGVTCDRGGLFSEAVAKARRVDPKANPYPAADIIFVLREEVKLKDKTLPAGTKLGHTTSTSNWQDFGEFIREATQAGLIGQEVNIKLTSEAVTGKKNGYTWGILKFALDN